MAARKKPIKGQEHLSVLIPILRPGVCATRAEAQRLADLIESDPSCTVTALEKRWRGDRAWEVTFYIGARDDPDKPARCRSVDSLASLNEWRDAWMMYPILPSEEKRA